MSIELSLIGSRISELETERELMAKYLDLRKQLNDMHGVMDAAADIREMDARIDELRKLQSAFEHFVPIDTLPKSQVDPFDPGPTWPGTFDPGPTWPGILNPDLIFGSTVQKIG